MHAPASLLLLCLLLPTLASAQESSSSEDAAAGDEGEDSEEEESDETPADEGSEGASPAAEATQMGTPETPAVDPAAATPIADELVPAAAPADPAAAAPAAALGKVPVKVSLVAEGGVVWLAGNSRSITANGGLHFGLSRGRHAFALNFGGNYGRSNIKTDVDTDGDGVVDETTAGWTTTATRVFGDLRYDLSLLIDLNSLYLGVGAFHDPFAGYTYRLRGDFGYSHQLVRLPVHKLTAEGGVNYTRDLYVDDLTTPADDDLAVRTQNFVGARLFVGYTLTPTEFFGFRQTIELLVGGTNNADARFDGRLLSESSITANISKIFSVKLGFLLNYDFVPPDLDGVPGPDVLPLDTTTTATLVATLF